jgi:hypothetical protein
VLYVAEPGRASVLETLRASCRHSAEVGALADEAIASDVPGDTGAPGEARGGWALSGVHAAAATATPPSTNPRRAARISMGPA